MCAGLIGASVLLIAGLLVHQAVEIKQTQTAIQAVKSISDEVTATHANNTRLISELKRFEQSVSAPTKFQFVYQELSRIIPDDTWMQTLSYSSHGLVLSGFSRDPQNLLSALHSSSITKHSKFTELDQESSAEGYFAFTLEMMYENISGAGDG